MLRGYASGCASGVCFARAPPSTNTYLGPRKKILTHIYTLQIQNRSFSRVCSNTRGLHTKPEVFENLIIFEVWLLFWIPCWIKSACWCVFFLAKLTVFACQTQLAMSWLAQPRLLPHPLSKRLCVFCRCPFTNHVQTVENPVKSQPSKPVQKVRVSTGLVRV